MIYLDNSATTRQHPRVTEKMIQMMDVTFGNPSSLHHMGLEGEKAIKEARGSLLDALGGGRESGRGREFNPGGVEKGTVVFTSGGTEADNMAVFGAAEALKRRGKKIVSTAVEHPAVEECLSKLEEMGFDVVRIGVDQNCRLDTEQLEDAIDGDTILVSIMGVNNEVGTVMPVNEVAEMVKGKNASALIHCDGVQSFGKIPVPAGIDMLSISGHKIHGPKGSGALWLRKGVNIPPFIRGGGQEKGMRSGTENVPAIAGLGVAAAIGTENMESNFKKAESLRKMLMEGLEDGLEDIIINSPRQGGSDQGSCSPYILNVSFLGTRGEVILHTLEQDEIYVSTGSACSSNKKGQSHVLKAMGLKDKEIEGAIRFSLSWDNTPEEIEKTVEKTVDAVKRFRMLGSFR